MELDEEHVGSGGGGLDLVDRRAVVCGGEMGLLAKGAVGDGEGMGLMGSGFKLSNVEKLPRLC